MKIERSRDTRVVGIDVGGVRRGFHMVCMAGDGHIIDTDQTADVPATLETITRWGGVQAIPVVAIDSPCGWSASGGSREAERSLEIGGQRISCFCTPTEARAGDHQQEALRRGANDFYGWVRNGMALFDAIAPYWPSYRGTSSQSVAIETFPHAVASYLNGGLMRAGVRARRALVSGWAGPGKGTEKLRNADLVDAGLCAIAALAFVTQQHHLSKDRRPHGNEEEGFIVVPSLAWKPLRH